MDYKLLGQRIRAARLAAGLSQEQLAEMMSVSRQTISKWEADEVIPELDKIVALSDLFACKLDAMVKEDMSAGDAVYSEIIVKKAEAFQMARYVLLSPNPEDDVNAYMENWARRSGLLKVSPDAIRIGWDFPFVPPEMTTRFGIHGYVAAYILPEGFEEVLPEIGVFASENL